MAKNGAKGIGRVNAKKHSRKRNPQTGLWTDRVSATGLFEDIKTSGGAFKGVRREG